MAKNVIKIKLNSAGIKALLQSGDVQADIAGRADAIAAAAGDGFVSDTRVVGGSSKLSRAIGRVYTDTEEARRAEAEDRALTRALDAGR